MANTTSSYNNAKEIGIIMLDTKFPRIPGDVGNPETFSFPVRQKVVKGASVKRVVHEGDPELLLPFIEAAQELEKEGVVAITTSCGFLAMFHKELVNAVDIPVFTSSLLQVNLAQAIINKKQKVGILTARAEYLTEKHFKGVGIEGISKIVKGMDNYPYFTNAFIEGDNTLDIEKVRQEMVQAAWEMIQDHPEIGAVVLECTNMPPYAKDVQIAVQRPVFDVVTMLNYAYSALVPKDFGIGKNYL